MLIPFAFSEIAAEVVSFIMEPVVISNVELFLEVDFDLESDFKSEALIKIPFPKSNAALKQSNSSEHTSFG